MSNTNRDSASARTDSQKPEARSISVLGNIFQKHQSPSEESTTVRRTLVERGVRPTGETNTHSNQSSTATAIATLSKQHQDEQQQLQDLNNKFATYLDRVQYLEDKNKRLTSNLVELKQSWGGDMAEIQGAYDPKLKELHDNLDKAICDQAKQELQLKRFEYDVWQLQEQIAALDAEYDEQHLNKLKQELDASHIALAQFQHLVEKNVSDLEKLRTYMNNLLSDVQNLKHELDNEQLERIMIQSELQTLKEHVSFQNSIFQVQRKDFLSLNTPSIDVSSFYRTELTNAISEIRRDFETLFHTQTNELEEYYRVKTEQVRAEIEAENERKRLMADEDAIDLMDIGELTTTLRNGHDELLSLQNDNKNLQTELDAMFDDLERIQNEHVNDRDSYDREIVLIREQLADKQAAIDAVLENNVSLRFEMSTYRGLLQVEEQHLNRMGQELDTQNPSISSGLAATLPLPTSRDQSQTSSTGNRNKSETKKMTVQKTARGPISFDSIDLENDAIILINERYSGSEQSFRDWSIRRQLDGKSEILYRFPPSFCLRPRQIVRILSKRSANAAGTLGDSLIADSVDTWGIGQQMITRLIDNNNDEKAIITQTFQ